MLGRKLARSLIREQSGDGHANESVKSVPDQVEGGNFVGEEFDGEKSDAGDNDWPTGKQLQSGWEWEMAETGEESEDGDGRVEVQAGGEGDGGEQGEKLARRNVQNVEHYGIAVDNNISRVESILKAEEPLRLERPSMFPDPR